MADRVCRQCSYIQHTSPTQVAWRCRRHCEEPGGEITRCHVLPDEPACSSYQPRRPLSGQAVEAAAAMWASGAAASEVAAAAGVTVRALYDLASRRRDLFPFRRPRLGEALRAEAVGLVRSGEMSAREVAALLDVDHTTVSRWVRREAAA